MSKLITTDSLAKLSAGLDARYKALINDSVGGSIDAAQTSILVEVKKQVDEVKEMLGGKALVYLTQAEYDALSEEEKNNENIVYNITDAKSADHEHENLDLLNKITTINITIGEKTHVLDFNGNLNFSLEDIGVDTNHKHDEYYTEEEINNVVSNLETLISGKSDTGHNHDNRYYTETEMNELLSKKASKDHSHDEFDTFAIKSEMNSALDNKANKQHEHDEYVTKLGLEEDLEDVETSINAVSQSVTTLETTLRGEINKKSDSGHNHNDLYLTKEEVSEDISEAVTNSSNELIAEINRIENMFDGRSIVYLTQAEYDALSEAEKNNETITYFITDADDSHSHDDLYYTEDEVDTLLAGKSDLGHTHDDRYYTETEINTLLADKANKTHEHNDLATVDSLNNAVSTINAEIAKKSDKTHKHDDDYYNKTEATTNFKNINDALDSMDQEITTLETSLNGKISNAQTNAQNYADQKITALVNSAPEAMNTLGELAKAISDHQTVYEGYVETVSGAIANAKAEAIAEAAKKDTALHTTITTEINSAVKVESDRAKEAEEQLQSNINGKADLSHGTHVVYGDTNPSELGTASPGSSSKVSRADHVHPIPEHVSNAGSADQVAHSLTIRLNSGTTENTNQFVFNGSATKTINVTPDNINAAKKDHTHEIYCTQEQLATSVNAITCDRIGASPVGHGHDRIVSRGNVSCETANTKPTISGLSMSQAYNNGYPTNYGNVMTMSGSGDGQLLIGWSGTSGAHAPAYIRSKRDINDANWSEWAQIYTTANKPTVDDIGAAKPDNTIVSVSASSGVLTLTRDKRQKCTNLLDGTQIQFPSVSGSEFLEIHLYFNSESNLSIALPDNCKWRIDPNLDAGTSFELIATWNSMEWLVNLIVYS